MLLKNGKEKQEFDNSMKNDLAKGLGYDKFGDIKWPIGFDWDKSQMREVTDQYGNKATAFPNSHWIELVETVKKDKSAPVLVVNEVVTVVQRALILGTHPIR